MSFWQNCQPQATENKRLTKIDTADMGTKTTGEFVRVAKEKWGEQFDYSEVDYKSSITKVKIICGEHGPFMQRPVEHLRGKQGCKGCAKDAKAKGMAKDTGWFVAKAKEIHGDKYTYEKAGYRRSNQKLTITCKEHGDFEQEPNNHLSKRQGCPDCKKRRIGELKRSSTEEFISKAIAVHGGKYDYSMVDYQGSYEPVTIICEKHGEFDQIPNTHLTDHGCPKCNRSKGEEAIARWLDENQEMHCEQWTCKELGTQRFDFYVPKYNTLIEFDGDQHRRPVDHFGGLEKFKDTKERDFRKGHFAAKHRFKLLRIPSFLACDIPRILGNSLQNRS